MLKILGIVFLFISQVAWAASSTLSCVPLSLKAQNKTITLPGVEDPHTTQIYFLQNISQQSLWIDHPTAGKSVSAGWSSYLHPQKWSAILINRKNFVLNCAVIQPGKVDYLNCAKSVKVCVASKTVFHSKRKGSYWLAEDKEWTELLVALEKRGME